MNRLAAVRAGYGTILLLAPDLASRVTGLPPDRTSRAVVRVLGARHLAQAVSGIGASSRIVLAVGVEIDALHGLSMLGLAALDPARRRSGVIDAVVAGCFAGAGALSAARPPRHQGPPTDRRDRMVELRTRIATRIARYTLPPALFRRLR